MYALLWMPTLLSLLCIRLPTLPQKNHTPSPIQSHPNIDLSSDANKLSYLYAWQSIQNTKTCLMNFTPGGYPICIDIKASSCISNDMADFNNLTPLSNTVLRGISNGLTIEVTGMICWKITTDLEDEVNRNIYNNSLYAPKAPMHLLSLQSVVQQLHNTQDGFHVHANKGTFIFASFKKLYSITVPTSFQYFSLLLIYHPTTSSE